MREKISQTRFASNLMSSATVALNYGSQLTMMMYDQQAWKSLKMAKNLHNAA